MYALRIGDMINSQSFISSVGTFWTNLRSSGHDTIEINHEQYSRIKEEVSTLRDILKNINVPMSTSFADDFMSALGKGVLNKKGDMVFSGQRFLDLELGATNLCNFLGRELKTRPAYILVNSKNDLFDVGDTPFGPDVDAAFNNSEDLSEAANCLALGRYTACVFHLMRAMETSVAQLSLHLGVENVTREWGKLLSDIKPKIESMQKGELRDQWSESLTLLYHVKQAWRNSTMHPKQTYTEDEAQAIYNAVKAFLVDLAPLVARTP